MISLPLLFAALVACTSAVPTTRSTTPTVYLAGDSTMAKGGGGSGTQGWGQYLQYSLTIPVVNEAAGGRSARSYTREGRFETIAGLVKSGDFVIIEFGHNDGGSLTPTDNGRSDCAGDGSQTCESTYDGTAETVLTFPAYLENATKLLASKGAHVILSAQTPDNTDQTAAWTYTPSRFVGYAESAASSAGASFVNHGLYVADAYKAMSVSAVDALYPNDHTHTSPAGADMVHKAFVKAIRCGSHFLNAHVMNATNAITGSCVA